MENEQIKQKIIDVLKQIQDAGEFQKIEITSDSCPGTELTEFDSQLWVVANTLLGEEIEGSIPDNVNVFISEDGKTCLSVEQIAERISRNLGKGVKK